jgi:hypothetical protein
MTQEARALSHYRSAMRQRLLALLEVVNPADAIEYGKLRYPELVVYVLDWLQTEAEDCGAVKGRPVKPPLDI